MIMIALAFIIKHKGMLIYSAVWVNHTNPKHQFFIVMAMLLLMKLPRVKFTVQSTHICNTDVSSENQTFSLFTVAVWCFHKHCNKVENDPWNDSLERCISISPTWYDIAVLWIQWEMEILCDPVKEECLSKATEAAGNVQLNSNKNIWRVVQRTSPDSSERQLLIHCWSNAVHLLSQWGQIISLSFSKWKSENKRVVLPTGIQINLDVLYAIWSTQNAQFFEGPAWCLRWTTLSW